MMFKQKLNVVNENYCGIFKWRNHNVQKSTLKFNKNLKKKLQVKAWKYAYKKFCFITEIKTKFGKKKNNKWVVT